MSKTLLYLEDDAALAGITSRGLARKGYEVYHFSSIDELQLNLRARHYDYALLDLKIGSESSLALVKTLHSDFGIQVVVLTGYGSIRTTVQAMKLGAVNFLSKPSSIDEIVAAFDEESETNIAQPELAKPSLKNIEWETIQKALDENGGNISGAARQLKMHRRTLQRKLQKKRLEL